MPPVDYVDGTVVPGTRYRVVRPLSTSGMGVVYEVEDVTIGRRFVMKTLHSALRDEGNLAKRLATEARVLAKLDHPNIVAIVTAGVTDDALKLPYFVMERLEGQTLRAVLDVKGRLPLPAVYTVGIEVLDALDCAHGLGVVHRDVKPENVFLHRSADGSAFTKLLDFGVVSVLESTGHDTGERFLGTPRYASPEQCRGEKPLPPSDLYAAALVVYEMISGVSPFEGVQGRGAWLEAHAFRAPKPLGQVATVARELEILVMSGLEKDPSRRPRDAFTFAAELRRLKADPSPFVPSPPPAAATLRPGSSGTMGAVRGVAMPAARIDMPTFVPGQTGTVTPGSAPGGGRTVVPVGSSAVPRLTPSGTAAVPLAPRVPFEAAPEAEAARLEAGIVEACERARTASLRLAWATTDEKDQLLAALAAGLRDDAASLVAANRRDVERARALGLPRAKLDALQLDDARVGQLARRVEAVRALADPCGTVVSEAVRPDGVRIRRVREAVGAIAVVYEARPGVTVDASALGLKAGNAVVLRGGSEAAETNDALGAIVRRALARSGLPEDAVLILPPGPHDLVRVLVAQASSLDLVIARGGEALLRTVTAHARVPVLSLAKCVGHLYLDGGTDGTKAAALAVDATLPRPGACGALTALLVDAADSTRLLPLVARALVARGCELRGCDRSRALVPAMRPAEPSDFGAEASDGVLVVRVVDGLDGALAHVARYGSGHTEAILTPHDAHAERWRREVRAACVVVNASPRLHDAGELGLGAEIGMATSHLHGRGPVGLEALTALKWMVDGSGEVR